MSKYVELLRCTPDYMNALTDAISMCHQKQAGERVVKHCIEAGHLSVLEHAYATFKLKCSVQTLLQLTRHRHLSFTVQSSRVTELSEMYEVDDPVLDEKIAQQANYYLWFRRYCKEANLPTGMTAYLAPKAMMYNLVVTGNLRAWYEYLPKRLCARAQIEHNELALEIKRQLAEAMPEIFADVKAPCATCKESGCAFGK